MIASTEQAVKCESGKLLCRVDARGLWLWCDKHKRQELFTWSQLDALEATYTRVVEVVVSDHTTVL